METLFNPSGYITVFALIGWGSGGAVRIVVSLKVQGERGVANTASRSRRLRACRPTYIFVVSRRWPLCTTKIITVGITPYSSQLPVRMQCTSDRGHYGGGGGGKRQTSQQIKGQAKSTLIYTHYRKSTSERVYKGQNSWSQRCSG